MEEGGDRATRSARGPKTADRAAHVSRVDIIPLHRIHLLAHRRPSPRSYSSSLPPIQLLARVSCSNTASCKFYDYRGAVSMWFCGENEWHATVT